VDASAQPEDSQVCTIKVGLSGLLAMPLLNFKLLSFSCCDNSLRRQCSTLNLF
jgi:hypothetical protein